jgi:HEAT repeat protein
MQCWAEVDARMDKCPYCGADQSTDQRSYEDKIAAALEHPLPQARARVCWLIGENRLRTALPRLIEMAEGDPDIYVQKAAVEALGALRDPRSDELLRAISTSENRFLAKAAKESLNMRGRLEANASEVHASTDKSWTSKLQ